MGGGQETEVTKTYSSVGRGGVGNLVEAKKNENKSASPPLPKITPIGDTTQLRSTGRGGFGNIRAGQEESSTERERNLSTSVKPPDMGFGSGRGGFGNIEMVKQMQRQKEEEKAKRDALAAEKARADARAAAEAIQMPKPTKSM